MTSSDLTPPSAATNIQAAALQPTGPGVLILGASSTIARTIASELARQGRPLVLAGRDAADLEIIAEDLRIRHGVAVETTLFDALDFAGHASFFAGATRIFDAGLEGFVLCHGLLGDQKDAQSDPALCRQILDVNFTSAVAILELSAAYLEGRTGKPGFIAALSSVAGDRGRQSNYLYGSAKAGLSIYLQGLRNRLFRYGIAVITIKPGFVDTSMTWGILKPGSPLVAGPDRVAADIVQAIDRRRSIIYTPSFWRLIMLIIRGIPEPIFKRLKL